MASAAPITPGGAGEALTAAAESKTAIRWAAAASAILALAVYFNSLQNDLVYDDLHVIVGNEAAHHPLDWRTILGTPSWFLQGNPSIQYRPLTTWTFALDYAVHGQKPFGYHLVNVLAHAGVSVLVVLLGASLGLSARTAALAGALFAVHPIHTEAVASVVGRAEILAAGLALLALLWQRAAARGTRPLLASTAAVAAYGLALFAKEHAIGLLVVLPLADLVAADGGSVGLFLRRLRGRRAAFYLALLAATAGYLALRRAALGDLIGGGGVGFGMIDFQMNPAASAPTALRVLTALEVLALAVWLLVFPLHLSADYSYRHIPVVESVREPGVAAGLLLAAALAVLALILWRRRRVGFLWLALALASYGVVANILFPIGTIFAERLLYLPSVGFCALVAMALARPFRGWRRAAAGAVAAALVIGWGVRARARNPVWRDEVTIAESMVETAPDSAHAHHVLGTTYSNLGRNDEALRELARAIGIYPDDVTSLYNIGVIYQRTGHPLDALTVYRRVTDLDPNNFPAWVNRAAVNNSQGMFLPGLDYADKAVALRPDQPNGHIVRGFALRGLERLKEAQAAFEEAVRIAPESPEALVGLGATALDEDDFQLAASAFERLVKVLPSQDAYRGLVSSYSQAGRDEDAARVAAKARELFPDDPFFRP